MVELTEEDDPGLPKKPAGGVVRTTAEMRYDLDNALTLNTHADINETFPEPLHGVVAALRNLDAAGYTLLIRYFKRQVLVGEIFAMDPPNESLNALLHAMRQLRLKDARWQHGKHDEEDEMIARDKAFEEGILCIAHTECRGVGINVRNPVGNPNQQSGYDSLKNLRICLGQEKDDDSNVALVQPDPQHAETTLIITPKRIISLKNGDTVVLGRSRFKATQALGIEYKKEAILNARGQFGDLSVSRACLRVHRSADGKSIILLDCGTKNRFVTEQANEKIMYFPDSLMTTIEDIKE